MMKSALDLYFGKQLEHSTTPYVKCFYLVQKYTGEENGIPQFDIRSDSIMVYDGVVNRLDPDLVFAYLDTKTGLPEFYHRQDIIDGHVKLPGFLSTKFSE